MDTLLLTPQNAGYAVSRPQGEVVRQDMDGDAGIYSAGIEGGTSTVDVTWLLDSWQAQYLEAFYRDRTGFGSEPFLISLLLDGSPFQQYTAYFLPGSLKLTETRGISRGYSAQLEVYPVLDDLLDSAIVDIFEVSPTDPEGYLDLFAPIIAAWPLA